MSIQTLCRGRKSLALGWQRRNKDPALSRFRPLRCRPFSIASTLLGQQPETLRYFAEGRQHTNSLRSSSTVDIVRHLRSGNAPIDLGWVAHPLDEVFRARSIAEQMGKDLLRDFYKELAFFILGGLEE